MQLVQQGGQPWGGFGVNSRCASGVVKEWPPVGPHTGGTRKGMPSCAELVTKVDAIHVSTLDALGLVSLEMGAFA